MLHGHVSEHKNRKLLENIIPSALTIRYSIKQEMSEYKPTEMGFFGPASWSTYLTLQIKVLQSVIGSTTGSIEKSRQIQNKIIGACPESFEITEVKIPRYKEVVMDGMQIEDMRGEIDAEWVFDTKNGKTDVTVLFFHGGGFTTGTPKGSRALTSALSIYGKSKVLAINYRKSPEHVFPCALHDCLSSYIYLLKDCKINAKNIVITGSSSGGNLAIALGLYLRENATKLGIKVPAGLIGISPALDLSRSQPSVILNHPFDYLGLVKPDPNHTSPDRSVAYIRDNSIIRNPLVSPMYAEIDSSKNNEMVQDLPPICIQVGSLEILYHESLKFVEESLRKSAGEVKLEVYEDMIHIFHLLSKDEFLSKVAVQNLGKFIVKVANNYTPSSKYERDFRLFKNKPMGDPSLAMQVSLENPLEIVESAKKFLDAQKTLNK
ncbi:hypothetical protein HK098_003914 [Nowakowskiella sp. JEL0407]|nr:hypothetical protein HK098_003914 [Nowakowskiella sp. JEL0407]